MEDFKVIVEEQEGFVHLIQFLTKNIRDATENVLSRKGQPDLRSGIHADVRELLVRSKSTLERVEALRSSAE